MHLKYLIYNILFILIFRPFDSNNILTGAWSLQYHHKNAWKLSGYWDYILNNGSVHTNLIKLHEKSVYMLRSQQ